MAYYFYAYLTLIRVSVSMNHFLAIMKYLQICSMPLLFFFEV